MGLLRADARPSHTAKSVVRLERTPPRDPPWEVIALGLLVFAAISGGGWGFARARRSGPPPEPDAATHALERPEDVGLAPDAELRRLLSGEGNPVAVEAELQELIAEERARHRSREAAAIRVGPG